MSILPKRGRPFVDAPCTLSDDGSPAPPIHPGAISMSERQTINLPAMCFEHVDKHEDGHYFLVALKDGQYDSLDGCHSEPEGVAQALHLISRLAVLRHLHVGRDYYMVHITKAPAPDGSNVNHEAVAQNNRAFASLSHAPPSPRARP
jgi:hypothetical protein